MKWKRYRLLASRSVLSRTDISRMEHPLCLFAVNFTEARPDDGNGLPSLTSWLVSFLEWESQINFLIKDSRKFASLTKNWFYILISFFFLGLLGKKINIPFPLMFPCHSLKWTSPISYNSYCKLLNEEGRYIFDFGYSLPLHFVMCFEILPTLSNLISKGLYEKAILS